MESRNELPPTQTIRPIDAPPDTATPTIAQLKADIDSGKTGDKAEVFDPGLSPLGTDDEAAGTPNEPHRIRLARALEGAKRWAGSLKKPGYAHHHADPSLLAFGGLIAVIAMALVAGLSFTRP